MAFTLRDEEIGGFRAPQDQPSATIEPSRGAAAARRALEEAAARRRQASPDAMPTEIGGRDGLEPVRYGDWEVRGLASDF